MRNSIFKLANNCKYLNERNDKKEKEKNKTVDKNIIGSKIFNF